MIRVIENSPACVIQKVTHKSTVVGYQIVPKGAVGDSSQIVRVPTLTAARDFAQRVNAAVAIALSNAAQATMSEGDVSNTETQAA